MGTIKQIDIKNRTYYFHNDMIDIKTFDSDLLKIDKKSYKDIGIYNIGYITKYLWCKFFVFHYFSCKWIY